MVWRLEVGTARAQTGVANQAGLVIDDGTGEVATYCIPFDTPEISGLELLQRSGQPLTLQSGGVGVAVCRLDGVGCPEQDCFCACRGGGECIYWSYWHWQEGAWRYASAGAAQYRVRPGAVDGWRWGVGDVTAAVPPPAISFETICAAGETVTDTPQPDDAPTTAQSDGSPPPLDLRPYGVFLLAAASLAALVGLAQWRRG